MDTTAAARAAGVTAATVRTWCRTGAVSATRTAGRWIIDPASLARRIRIGAGDTTTNVVIDRHPKTRPGRMAKRHDGQWSYGIATVRLTPSGWATRGEAELAAAVQIAHRARRASAPAPAPAPEPAPYPRRGWSKYSRARTVGAEGYCPHCGTDDYACEHATG